MEKRPTGRKKKFRLKKGFKLFLTGLAIILLFVLKSKGVFDLSKIGKVFGPKEKELSLVNAIQLDEETVDLNIFNGKIVQLVNNRLVLLGKDGNLENEREFEIENPALFYGKNYLYVVDEKNGSIHTINENCKSVRDMSLGKEIYNLKESNGNLIFHRKEEGMEQITILDEDGYKAGEFTYEGKSVLSYMANDSNTKKITASLVTEPDIKSVIDIYDGNNSLIDTLDIDGEIVMYLKYLDEENLVILTDSGVYKYSDGEIKWKEALDLVHDIYIADDIIYLLYDNKISTMDYDGKIKKTIEFEGKYTSIKPFESGIILYGKEGLSYMVKNKEVLRHVDKINKVYTDGDSVYIWTPSRLNEYKIMNK